VLVGEAISKSAFPKIESFGSEFDAVTRLHQSFEDPATFSGSDEDRLAVFRRVRDELRACLHDFTNSVE
jgi:hypothetical protein